MTLTLREKQLYKFIGREYILAFLVAFAFFFFIFFINQILLLARKILLSNVDFFTMLNLVVLAIPQFLLYTFPFASLSGAAMVIGDLNSSNEILALRTSGFSMNTIFKPIIVLSILISILCFLIADILLPYSASQYQQLYVQLLTKTPGVELKSYSSTVFDDLLISNGLVNDNKIEDIIVLNSENKDGSTLINSKEGVLNLIDPSLLIYSIDLDTPKVVFSNLQSPNYWKVANASNATYYIDFSNTLSKVSANLPSNLSSVDLITKINKTKPILEKNVDDALLEKSETILHLAKNFAVNKNIENINIHDFTQDYNTLNRIEAHPIDFYLQYYRAEFNKKIALSAACFFLILITIPLSYLKFKHGRLIGFGISMFVAVMYWYLLFLAQIKTFQFAINPLFLMWAPNIVILIISLSLIRIWRN
ncbi:MAG: LptF/LptG family permease [Sphaerochaetaceae bacterium]|nr:LptF/LptG family permease [Sphaerochaetaceae bacterium]